MFSNRGVSSPRADRLRETLVSEVEKMDRSSDRFQQVTQERIQGTRESANTMWEIARSQRASEGAAQIAQRGRR